MMLEHLGEEPAARAIEAAMERVLQQPDCHTPDLGGAAATADLGAAVADAVTQGA